MIEDVEKIDAAHSRCACSLRLPLDRVKSFLGKLRGSEHLARVAAAKSAGLY
jgi:hypothetical protein